MNLRIDLIKAKKDPCKFLHDSAAPVHLTVLHKREFAAISSNLAKIPIFQSYFCLWQFRNGKTYMNLHYIIISQKIQF